MTAPLLRTACLLLVPQRAAAEGHVPLITQANNSKQGWPDEMYFQKSANFECDCEYKYRKRIGGS